MKLALAYTYTRTHVRMCTCVCVRETSASARLRDDHANGENSREMSTRYFPDTLQDRRNHLIFVVHI